MHIMFYVDELVFYILNAGHFCLTIYVLENINMLIYAFALKYVENVFVSPLRSPHVYYARCMQTPCGAKSVLFCNTYMT